MFIDYFSNINDLKWSYGDHDAIGYPQLPRQDQQGEYSKYKLCSSKFDMAHVLYTILQRQIN